MYFEDFPKGDSLWFVKLIDGFRVRGRTDSSEVSVLLQKLPFKDPDELEKLDKDQLRSILGWDFKKDPPAIHVTRIHIGSLPAMRVGMVFRDEEFVGYLPFETRSVTLPGGPGQMKEKELMSKGEPPKDWGNLPFRLINRAEYGGIASNDFAHSRCMVFEHDGCTYILPSLVIFRTYYAMQTIIANEFSSRPWSLAKSRLIHEDFLAAGLGTQENPDTGTWDIVLKTTVRRGAEVLLAYLYFHPVGTARAESIYTNRLKDQAQYHGMWWAKASVPFADSHGPLQLLVSGYPLSLRRDSKPSKFFITDISASSFPEDVPKIRDYWLNDNRTAKNVSEGTGGKPYLKFGHADKVREGSKIVRSSDPNANLRFKDLPWGRFYWLTDINKSKIPKDFSQTYKGKSFAPLSYDGDDLSAGLPGYQRNAPPQVRARIAVDQVVERFKETLNMFEKLKDQGAIESFEAVEPLNPVVSLKIGDVRCWNFLANASGMSYAGEAWSYLWKPKAAENFSGSPRPALVLSVQRQVDGEMREGIWIEIGCRSSQAYVSVLLYDLAVDVHMVVSEALNVIAGQEGKNLFEAARKAELWEKVGKMAAHKHCFDTKDRPRGQMSLERFLTKYL